MKPTSVSSRLLPPIVGSVVALTLVILVAGGVAMRVTVVKHAERRSAAVGPAAAHEVALMMRLGDHWNLQDLVGQIGANPDIAVARVLLGDGTIKASSKQEEVGTLVPAHVRQERPEGDRMPASIWNASVIHTVQSFHNSSACWKCHDRNVEVLGVLDVDTAVNPHITGLTAFGMLSTLLGLLYVAAVVGIAAPTLSRVVVRPLRPVIDGFRAVESGELITVGQKTGTEEIDAVIDGYNGMIEQLRNAKVTEEQKRHLEMERAEQLASVGQMAAGLAHEFRNPLSNVKAVVEVVAAETPCDDPRNQVLHAAAVELDRMDQILRDLMQYARPRPPSITWFDLNAVVKEVSSLTVSPTSGRARVQIDTPPDPAVVVGDPDIVRQVLVNLLLNAQQAVPASIEPSISVSTGTNGAHAWCRVRDNGPGVPAARAQAIFQPFVTTKVKGTGLGLAISRRALALQNGQLTLDNPGEPGASFTFMLPLADSNLIV